MIKAANNVFLDVDAIIIEGNNSNILLAAQKILRVCQC
jgi:hypothetical protein